MTIQECISNLKRYKEDPINPTRNGWNYGRNGKTSKELEQMAHNMAKERGTTIENVARSLGVTIPSNR